MAYFTIFQDRLFPTAELPRGEREKIDEFLRLLEDSGVISSWQIQYKLMIKV